MTEEPTPMEILVEQVDVLLAEMEDRLGEVRCNLSEDLEIRQALFDVGVRWDDVVLMFQSLRERNTGSRAVHPTSGRPVRIPGSVPGLMLVLPS